MKANEIPEKIYSILTEGGFYLTAIKPEPPFADGIEYIRTDAFIEKALEFLDGCIPDYIDLKYANVDTFINVDNKRFIDEFIKYMKGE